MSDLPSDRGRQPVLSTGRGGAGNIIRSPSRGVDQEVTPGVERGREITPRDTSGDRVTHSGRGGAGNIRSPSAHRDPIAEAKEDALQERLVHEARGRQADAPFATGRGGAGNIRDKSGSRSRSQARGGGSPHPTGRGGFGNITHEVSEVDLQKQAAQNRYEAEVAAKHASEENGLPVHTGKGGAGNIGQKLEPVDMSKLTLEEQEAYKKVHAKDNHHYVSGGRGGAGNMRDASSDRGRSEHHHGGGLMDKIRSLSRSVQSRDKKEDA